MENKQTMGLDPDWDELEWTEEDEKALRKWNNRWWRHFEIKERHKIIIARKMRDLFLWLYTVCPDKMVGSWIKNRLWRAYNYFYAHWEAMAVDPNDLYSVYPSDFFGWP